MSNATGYWVALGTRHDHDDPPLVQYQNAPRPDLDGIGWEPATDVDVARYQAWWNVYLDELDDGTPDDTARAMAAHAMREVTA